MTAHLTLPYNWVNCLEPATCRETVHFSEEAETLNNQPLEWVGALLKNDIISSDGTIKLRDSNGKLCNPNGPAVQLPDGTLKWTKNGGLHREDGPAVTYVDGGEEWWLNYIRHRSDGPAVIKADGHKEWWVNGNRHRDDGPAIIYANGTEVNYLNGFEKTAEGEYENPQFAALRKRVEKMRLSLDSVGK